MSDDDIAAELGLAPKVFCCDGITPCRSYVWVPTGTWSARVLGKSSRQPSTFDNGARTCDQLALELRTSFADNLVPPPP